MLLQDGEAGCCKPWSGRGRHAVGATPDDRDVARDALEDRTGQGKPKPVVPVLLMRQRLVERANSVRGAAAYGERGDMRRAGRRQSMERIPIKIERRFLLVEKAPVEVRCSPPAVEDLGIGSSRRGLYQSREVTRWLKVVRVEKDNQLGVCERQAHVSRRSETSFFLSTDHDPLRETGEHVRRAISRAVVGDDQLSANVLLVEHALDGFGDERFAVANRDDDGHIRHDIAWSNASVGTQVT